MERTKLLIVDQAFAHSTSSSLDNIPKHIEWCRDFNKDKEQDLIIFTDQSIFQKPNFKCKKSIFWLIEPVSTFPYSYSFVKENYNHPDFADYVLTYDKELIKLNENLEKDKFIWYAHSGSWIPEEDFKVYPKTKMCSIISSGKNQTSGHRLRHSCIEYHGKSMDVMGRGYKPFEHKINGLKDYRYSVIIENIKMDDYFTEKVIDSLSVGCIPIYWGTENIGNYFDKRGILTFDTISDLGYILDNVISEEHYNSKLEYIKSNLEESKSYRVAEDYFYNSFLKPKGLV